MTCLIKKCDREATHTISRRDPAPAMCWPHHWYYVTFLADNQWIDRDPPPLENKAVWHQLMRSGTQPALITEGDPA